MGNYRGPKRKNHAVVLLPSSLWLPTCLRLIPVPMLTAFPIEVLSAAMGILPTGRAREDICTAFKIQQLFIDAHKHGYTTNSKSKTRFSFSPPPVSLLVKWRGEKIS